MRRSRQIGLMIVAFLVVSAAPYPDGQSISHPPIVIAAETTVFRVKPEDGQPTSNSQPMVYCGVTIC